MTHENRVLQTEANARGLEVLCSFLIANHPDLILGIRARMLEQSAKDPTGGYAAVVTALSRLSKDGAA